MTNYSVELSSINSQITTVNYITQEYFSLITTTGKYSIFL